MWQKANVVFVSGSKGNDNNNGLSTGTAVKTIEKALEKVDANLSVEDIIRKGLLNLAR